MGEGTPSEGRRANPRIGTKKKKISEFEFCKVCNLNHDQGLRHKFFPNHKKSLSTFLSRFQTKLSDIRFFLKNPISLRPELASRNRFWCVFCDSNIDELGSTFACANGIHHLASVDHVKNLKHFWWKYGGAMDQLDAFMISRDDVAKWEKRCMALKSEPELSSQGCRGVAFGPSSDIHNQHNNRNFDSFEHVYYHSVKSYISNGVLPLQFYTNEHQVSYSGLSGIGNPDTLDHHTSSLPSEACSNSNPVALQEFAVDWRTHSPPCNDRQWASDGYAGNRGVCDDEGIVSRESNHHGLQTLAWISSVPTESADGNVHSGALPPWFESTEGFQNYSKPVSKNLVSPSNKSKKLNPKRVGAAWAEKRKIELGMEKRGETLKNECDANWLPNFGRVWQSGSRKESRKEFEREKQKLLKVEIQTETPIKIQPYVGKRKRMDIGGDHASS